MTTLASLVKNAAAAIPNPTSAQKQILERLCDLEARIKTGRIQVAVLGQFKRGKSTLLNALLGVPVLPTGIVPVTAIPTFIMAGSRQCARIIFKDGAPTASADGPAVPDFISRYASEASNPANRLGVERVEVELPSAFLRHGIILIDTPGVGSTFVHNTKLAEATLTECDAAFFVVSADLPLTEVEANYLGAIKKLVPKLFFVMNKTDLLSSPELLEAEEFLRRVLREQPGLEQAATIFPVSARLALLAKQESNSEAFERSGLKRLEDVVTNELAHEKKDILLATSRQRAEALSAALLFEREFERKALLLPVETLRQKMEIFEAAMSRFESERQSLSDFITVDRIRLLRELELETDRLWNNAKVVAGQIAEGVSIGDFNELEARRQVAEQLSSYFDTALEEFNAQFSARLKERLAGYQTRASSIATRVRQTAADLMDISVSVPEAELAFEARREPYWASSERSDSLLSLSIAPLSALLPKKIRYSRIRRQLVADTDKIVLRNVANMEWALRQNIEDSFRRYELALSAEIARVLNSTRDAFEMALKRRASKEGEIQADLEEASNSTAVLADILREIKSSELTLE